MHPPIPVLNRVCTKRYAIPDSDLTLNVGEKLIIPAHSLHYDPAYYPNPDVFDPERFAEKNDMSRPLGTFVPFGDGPRICIGIYIIYMHTLYKRCGDPGDLLVATLVTTTRLCDM